jgi:Tfp pilus assembly protein PilX
MSRKGQEGIALVKVIFLTSILLAVAAYAARATRVEVRIAQNEYQQKRAHQIAEAGLNRAWKKLQTDILVWGGGSTMTAELGNAAFLGTTNGGTTQTYSNGNTYRFVPFGGTSNDGYWVRLINNSDDPNGSASSTDGDNKIVIESIGRVTGGLGNSEQQIRALFVQSNAFNTGLFAKYNLGFNGSGSSTDSYNSNNGAYGGSNIGDNGDVGANGNITGSGQPTINGSATAGGTIDFGNGIIDPGPTLSGAPQVALPGVPACNTTIGWSTGTGITAPNNSFRNNALTGNGQDNITLSSSGSPYCFQSISLSGQSTITATGPIQIYLTDASDLTGGGLINSSGSPPLPSSLQIYSSCSAAAGCGTSSSGGLKLTGGTNAYFTVYAPETNVKFNSNPGNIYGSVVGGNIDLGGGAEFHYDDALAGTGPSFTYLASWHEVRN